MSTEVITSFKSHSVSVIGLLLNYEVLYEAMIGAVFGVRRPRRDFCG